MSITELRSEHPTPVADAPVRHTRAALFAVDIEYRPGETVLHLRGELDLATQQLLIRELQRVQGIGGRIVLDLENVTFMDVGSASFIDRSRTDAFQLGTDVVLRSPQPIVRRLLELTGLCVGAVIS